LGWNFKAWYMECEVINQYGTVREVNDKIKVDVIVSEACGKCAMNGVCPVPKTRRVDAVAEGNYTFQPGDKVRVEMEERMGRKALFFGYILPFFVLLAVMIIVKIITGDDGKAGLAAIGSLIPYYFILFLFRKRFEKEITFKIKPL